MYIYIYIYIDIKKLLLIIQKLSFTSWQTSSVAFLHDSLENLNLKF